MLPIESLRAVRRIVTHGNCSDGRASAVILHAALPDAEIIEMVHNSAAHRLLRPSGDVLFCDFAPWLPEGPERVPLLVSWVASGAVVLDHHRGAENIVRAFGDHGVFADEVKEPGVSGAVLAWREVAEPMNVAGGGRAAANRDMARLVGIRDTWQRQSPDWQRACEVSEVLRFLPLDECLKRGAVGIMATADDIGPLLWAKKQHAAQEAAKTALRVTIGGLRVAIISSVNLTSDVCDVLRDWVDMVAGFDYVHTAEGVDLQWSLRSSGGFDVLAIAQANGGGGHSAAAGFKLPLIEHGWARLAPYIIADIVLSRGAP